MSNEKEVELLVRSCQYKPMVRLNVTNNFKLECYRNNLAYVEKNYNNYTNYVIGKLKNLYIIRDKDLNSPNKNMMISPIIIVGTMTEVDKTVVDEFRSFIEFRYFQEREKKDRMANETIIDSKPVFVPNPQYFSAIKESLEFYARPVSFLDNFTEIDLLEA